ncbi:MAG: hypothetical protein EPN41_15465 [Candidimonas sp.]|nr:MAG: hypothetical protein EPN41_15465 [Candidimonas sp.]
MTEMDGVARILAEAIEPLYGESLMALSQCLAASWMRQEPTGSRDDDIPVANAHLAYVVFSHGRAMRHLYDARDAEQMPTHLRPMFEAVIKSNYITHVKQERAADIFDILPFEQLRDANEYSRGAPFKDGLEQACLAVLRRRPKLLAKCSNRDAILGGKHPIPRKLLLKSLSFPHMDQMVGALHDFDPGWNPDLYPTIYRLCSKFIHGSVGFTRSAIGYVRPDATVAFNVEPNIDGAVEFLLQGSGYIMGSAGMVSHLFDLSMLPEETLNGWYERRNQVVADLRAIGYILQTT